MANQKQVYHKIEYIIINIHHTKENDHNTSWIK